MEIKNLFTPEAQQVGSQIAGVVRKAVKPLEKPIQDLGEQFTAKVQPAIQGIQETVNTGFVEPVMKPIERQGKITKVNKFLADKGITVDDIKNLAEVDGSDPEEALQFFRDNGIQIQGMEELQAQQPTQVQPIQQEGLADQFKMKSSEEFGVVENIKDFGKFLINAPADSVEALGQFYDAVTSPIETVKGMLKTGQGISDKAVFSIANSISSALGGSTVGPTENAQMVDEMYSYLKDTYGTAGKFKKAIVENPVDTLLTLMGGLGLVKKVAQAKNLTNVASNIDKIQNVINPVNILKKEAQIVTAVPKYIATKTIPEILGKTTGTSAETIRTAFRQGGTPEFQSALRGETTPQIILSNVQEGMQAIKNNRKIAYGEDYAKLQANKTILAIDDVVQNFVKSLQDEYKIGVGKKGLDFSQSKITGSTSQSQIENMYRDLVGWKDKTPEGLDVLKQRLQDYYRGTPESSKGDRLSTIASNAVKNKIVENVPEYAKMTETYEKLTNDIRDITKTLSLGDKTQAQTAITKLMSVLRDNFPARQDMIKIIEQYTGKNIQGQIAGSSLSPGLAKGLAGVITGGGIVFGQLANPAFWGGLAVASPRLIGEIANTIGIPIEKFKTAINNIKNANPSTTNTVNNLEGVPKKPVNGIPNTIKNAKQQGIKPKSTTTNVFGETIDKPSNKKGGFIKIPEIGKKSEIDANKFVKSKNPDITLTTFEGPDEINLYRLEIPKSSRKEGKGTKAMNDLIEYADKNGKRIVLTPDNYAGSSVSRLKEFYKRFGFVENTGRNKDFSTRELMYRTPKLKPEPKPIVKNPLVEEAIIKEIPKNELNKNFENHRKNYGGKFRLWFQEEDYSIKPQIARIIQQDKALLQDGLNNFHQQYKATTGENISLDEFLNKDITLYRGDKATKRLDEGFSAYSLDRSVAERFAKKNNGTVTELKIKPKDTYGMYQENTEAEVLVPRKISNKDASNGIGELMDTYGNDIVKDPKVIELYKNDDMYGAYKYLLSKYTK